MGSSFNDTAIDLRHGPVLAAQRGPVPRGPADLALILPRPLGAWRHEIRALATGRFVPETDLKRWAPLQTFGVQVFVRADRHELVLWRTEMGRPDCRWVTSDEAHADELRVAPLLWAETVAALSRQLGGADLHASRGGAL